MEGRELEEWVGEAPEEPMLTASLRHLTRLWFRKDR